ncbi:hypothetical protein CQW23_12738 [Capsicum baccatum]|uniref:Uncharacterized protein n=1 Tax=Capsicum baccatum TaxID=33114 RepID=A0A2G2WTM6_CAPBA|nr:hypothetical protein CQW23_12738 [Capsicum baccatum]
MYISILKEKLNKSARTINVSNCEIFSNGELSGMLQFASDLYLEECMGLRKLIDHNMSFDGLKSLYIYKCSCDFGPVEEGSGQFDPLPNLEYLTLIGVYNLKSLADMIHFRDYISLSSKRKYLLIEADNGTVLTRLLTETPIVGRPSIPWMMAYSSEGGARYFNGELARKCIHREDIAIWTSTMPSKSASCYFVDDDKDEET